MIRFVEDLNGAHPAGCQVIDAIVAAVTAVVDFVTTTAPAFIAGGLTDIGVGAATAGIAGEAITGGLVGGALGAGESAITGGDVLKGFESGAITGGVLGAGGPLLQEAGLGVVGADILAGTAGGALGAEATGGKPLQGAVSGAVSGGIAASLGGGPSAATPGGGTPGAGVPAPAGVPSTGGDISALPGNVLDPSTSLQVSGGGLSAASVAPAASLPSGTTTATGTAAPVASNVSANLPGQLSTGAAAGGTISNVGNSAAALAPFDTPSIGSPQPTDAFSPEAGASLADVTKIPGAAAVTASGGGGLASVDDFLSRNKDWLVPGALTGAEALMGQQKPPFYNQLATEAKTLGTSGTEMMSYLKEGRLPPGLQANVDTAANAAKASIRSMYASRGMSGSSAEAQDLANVDTAAVSQGANIALSLFQKGLDETQLSEQLYMQLMNVAVSQDEQLGSAIGNFASSVALAQRPVNVLAAA